MPWQDPDDELTTDYVGPGGRLYALGIVTYLRVERFIRHLAGALLAAPDEPLASAAQSDAMESRFHAELVECDTLLKTTPSNPEVLHRRGVAHSNLNQFRHAIRSFDAALAADPARPATLSLRGVAHSRSGDVTKAESDLDAAIRMEPSNGVYYSNRGLASLHWGRHARAEADLTAAIAVGAGSVVDCHYCRGIARQNMGRHAGAIEDYSEVLRRAPEYDADVYFRRGQCRERLGDRSSALRDLNHAVLRAPGTPSHYSARASLHTADGRMREAVADYTEVLRITPRDIMAYHLRGVCNLALNEHHAALRDFHEVRKRNPLDPAAYINIGTVHKETGSIGLALQFYDRAVLIAPDAHNPRYARGLLFGQLDYYAAARQELLLAMHLGHDSIQVGQALVALQARVDEPPAAS